ncbi:thiamine phosphate synthase [Rhizobium paranaense]|uniref:Thiamine-phosphate synthase n=1 Tax=Rhizobium paranaense TaxID=1650438 RepID=A0A7W8XU45_9HYPH|nr:thiamine-phosphate pyrophosphorylase [Rhizobium paranaense]
MRLDPFYLIVDSAAWIERLVPLGVKLVQLRIKERALPDIRADIRRAKAVCAAHACQLIVNDYWQLAIEEGCDFIHLGQEDLATADLSAIREAGLKLGLSTHDEAELATALAARPDYIALGPIYPTILKVMPWAPQGLDRLRDWKSRIGSLPLVAIGGLTVERIAGVFENGADSAAVVTDITRNPDPEQRTLAWIGATRSFHREG